MGSFSMLTDFAFMQIRWRLFKEMPQNGTDGF